MTPSRLAFAIRAIRIGAWLLVLGSIGLSGLAWLFPATIGQWIGGPGVARLAREMEIGVPFALTDHDGRQVTEKDFAGRPYLVFFGYTFCPDICPTTMAYLSELLSEAGPAAASLPVLFVTVDSARDTPAVLKDYVASFDPRLLGLTGSERQVRKVISDWGIYARKISGDGGDYTIDHTSSVFLIGAAGRLRATIDVHDETPGANLAKLKRLADGR